MLTTRYFYLIFFLFTPVICVTAMPLSEGERQMVKPSPKTDLGENNQMYYKIELPRQTQESHYQVELLFSTKTLSDCNEIRYSSNLEHLNSSTEARTYRLTPLSKPLPNTMPCVNPLEWQATPIIVTNNLVAYDSQLPMMIGVPKEINVSYRIWAIEQETQNAIPFE